jgi:glycosyltransferase involved in cell wall biosynthesis
MKNPKVSVVIPAYNHEKYVGEAIQSVLDQTFQDFELIIINDGSTDNTEAEILKFKDERIWYYSQKNQGLSATLNRGIELARGEYFNFFPSDDAFYPEKFEIQLKSFEGDTGLGLVFAYPQLVDAKGREIKEDPAAQWAIVPYETKEEIFPALFERNFLSAPTALIKMDCFKKVGIFDESLKYAQDYDMWMRVLKYFDIRLLKQPLVKYRWHGENLTYQATPQTELERAKVLLKAYKNLAIEEIFPHLYNRKEIVAYQEANEKLAAYIEKSGIPTLIPISQIYRDTGKSLMQKTLNLPEIDKKRMEEESDFGPPKNMRKIHLLVETLSLDKGGMEQVIFDLVRGLDRDLFNIVVVVVEKGGAIANRCKEIGIPVEILRHDKPREYQEILERYQIDLVLSHYSTFGARLAFEKGIPSVSVIHNIYSWFPDNILSDFRSADPFVSRYIAVSEEVKEYTCYRFNIPSEKITVIPNGMDVDAYTSRPTSHTLSRSELGFNDDDYIFVNVAAISPPKGQNVILTALKKIVHECPKIRVLSIGDVLDEAYFDFLKNKAVELQLTDHLGFIGFVEDIRPYLQVADAFLLTSFIEGWPLSVMEAMLHRLPLILTRVGGVSAMLGDSGAGVLVDNNYEDLRFLDVPSIDELSREESPRNAEEVAHAMRRFYKDKELWRQAGQEGYVRISRYFTLQGAIRSYEKELITVFLTLEKTKVNRPARKIEEEDKHLRGKEKVLQEKLLLEKEKTINVLRGQEAYYKDLIESKISRLGSEINCLESEIGLRNEVIEKRLDYILIRLSLTERVKGIIYRLMKKIHNLVSVRTRERYRGTYRKVFFDKVTPANGKIIFEKTTPTEQPHTMVEGEKDKDFKPVSFDSIKDFLTFKEEITSGLPIGLEKFNAYHVPKRVSVVLPVYNQAHLVCGAIESVLNQTYQDLELIIVNDGSTDEIGKVLDCYKADSRVVVIDQANQKLPRALSNGFKQARGEFYTWTSADNLMGKRQMEVQVEFLMNNPKVQMVYSNYDVIDDQGNPLMNSDYCSGYQKPFGSNHIHLPRNLSELNVVRNNYIGPCFMYKGWVGRLVGDYDPFMFTFEDYDYWMIINDLFRIEHLGKEDILYFNRVHMNSLTGRKEELRIVENTDKLMEFEKMRREFFLKKFNIYLVGNHDHLGEVKRLYQTSGHNVTQFGIPCDDIKMEQGKVVSIWIYSAIERGFMARIMRENPDAFFVSIVSDPMGSIEKTFLDGFHMIVSISGKELENSQDLRWFYGEEIPPILYPILCKANIELFRKRASFIEWNP